MRFFPQFLQGLERKESKVWQSGLSEAKERHQTQHQKVKHFHIDSHSYLFLNKI